jgi:hypothetical protein
MARIHGYAPYKVQTVLSCVSALGSAGIAASALYWWTRKGWCSKRGSTARKWWIRMGSSSC